MTLTLSETDCDAIRHADKELFLGIITADDHVRVRAADPVRNPGHVEWLANDAIRDAVRGFSLLVHGGKVTAVFPRSRLNASADARLEDEYLGQLMKLLPVADDVRLLE